MQVRHKDKGLERLEADRHFTGDGDQAVVRGFRKVMQYIRSAVDERDLRTRRALRYEKLKGSRSHQRSLRINDQWRLILEWEGEGSGRTAVIVGIEDYH